MSDEQTRVLSLPHGAIALLTGGESRLLPQTANRSSQVQQVALTPSSLLAGVVGRIPSGNADEPPVINSSE